MNCDTNDTDCCSEALVIYQEPKNSDISYKSEDPQEKEDHQVSMEIDSKPVDEAITQSQHKLNELLANNRDLDLNQIDCIENEIVCTANENIEMEINAKQPNLNQDSEEPQEPELPLNELEKNAISKVDEEKGDAALDKCIPQEDENQGSHALEISVSEKKKSKAIFIKRLDLKDFESSCISLISEFKCMLCEGIYFNPVNDRCSEGHIFCYPCLESHLKINPSCPFSNEPIATILNASRVKVIDQILNKQIVLCKNRNLDCEWRGFLPDLMNHINYSCLKQIIFCPFECGLSDKREIVDLHMDVCLKRVVHCSFCTEPVAFFNMEIHYGACKKFRVECSQCLNSYEREMLEKHVLMECEMTMIECPYYCYGCISNFPRREIESHMIHRTQAHHSMLIESTNKLKSSLIKDSQDLKEEVRLELKEELKNLLSKEQALANEDNRSNFRKKNVRTKIYKSISVSNVNNFFPSQKILLQKKREKSKLQGSKIKQISREEPKIEPTPGERIEILVGDGNKRTQILDNKAEASTGKKDEPILEQVNSQMIPAEYSELIESRKNKVIIGCTYLQKIIDPNFLIEDDFLFSSRAITYLNKRNKNRILMFQPKYQGITTEFSIKINNLACRISVGVALRDIVEQNGCCFDTSYSSHGCFLFSSSGIQYNCKDKGLDSLSINNNGQFNVQKEDILHCRFVQSTQELKFKINSGSVMEMKIAGINQSLLTPCIVLYDAGDEIFFHKLIPPIK